MVLEVLVDTEAAMAVVGTAEAMAGAAREAEVDWVVSPLLVR